jgi:hypothetical protein
MDDNDLHDNDDPFLFPVLAGNIPIPVLIPVQVPGAVSAPEVLEFCRKLRENDPSISKVDTGAGSGFQHHLSDTERIAIAQSMEGSNVVQKLVLDPENFSERSATAIATVLCNNGCNNGNNSNRKRLQNVEIDGWMDDFLDMRDLRNQQEITRMDTVSIPMGAIQASTSVTEVSLSRVDLASASTPFMRLLTETKSLRKLRVAMAGFTLDLIRCNAPHIPLVLAGLHDHSTLRTLILDRLATLTGLDTLLQPSQRNHAISDLHISRYSSTGTAADELKQLVMAMQRNTTVAKLTISQSSIGRDQAKQLRAMFPRNQTLKSLNLVGNVINAAALRELATGLYRNTSLEHLDVADNQLHCFAAARVLRDLMRRNKSLTRMDIDRNAIGAGNHANGTNGAANGGHGHVGSIADGLRTNVTLVDVDLSGSMLGDAGVEVLVRGLRLNSTLTTLALCDNGIAATGIGVLVNSLLMDCTDCTSRTRTRTRTRSGITDLVLNCNPIGWEAVSLLANAESSPESSLVQSECSAYTCAGRHLQLWLSRSTYNNNNNITELV